MKIVNTGNQSNYLSLVMVDFTKVAEIHEMKIENDVMKMRKIKDGLEISAQNNIWDKYQNQISGTKDFRTYLKLSESITENMDL